MRPRATRIARAICGMSVRVLSEVGSPVISWIFNARPSQWGSAALVVLTGVAVGRQAAMGMSGAQWTASIIAIAAAVAAATLAHSRMRQDAQA